MTLDAQATAEVTRDETEILAEPVASPELNQLKADYTAAQNEANAQGRTDDAAVYGQLITDINNNKLT